MRLDQMISQTFSRLFGRLVRRAIAALVLGLFLIAVIYQLTAAGTLALGEIYGMVYARLIVAAILVVPVLGAVAFLVATRGKPKTAPTPAPVSPGAVGIAMLLETFVLGTALARQKPRSNLKRT